MRLSVVVPVYNKAPFIAECFGSIFGQTYGDFEVIAVDDKSTDGSLGALRSLGDPRLRVVPLERNLGPAGAAQRAMDLAQGEYIIRVDADDICAPDRFARQVGFMDRNPGLIASGSALQLFGDQEELWPYPVGEEACKAELLFGNPISQGASIVRTGLLRQHGLRYEDHWPRIGEDWIFWARIAPYGGFDNIAEPLVLYRRSASNSTHGQDQAQYRERVIREVFAMLGIGATDAEVESHVLLLGSFLRPPTAKRLRATRDWADRLRALNAERGLFPQEAFNARLEQAWGTVFFRLMKHGTGMALRHWLMGPDRPPQRLSYLAKVSVNRLLGRSAAR